MEPSSCAEICTLSIGCDRGRPRSDPALNPSLPQRRAHGGDHDGNNWNGRASDKLPRKHDQSIPAENVPRHPKKPGGRRQ